MGYRNFPDVKKKGKKDQGRRKEALQGRKIKGYCQNDGKYKYKISSRLKPNFGNFPKTRGAQQDFFSKKGHKMG